MKTKTFSLLVICMSLLVFNSCEKYLDIAPTQGLSENEVFSNYENFKLYFDAVYIKSRYTHFTFQETGVHQISLFGADVDGGRLIQLQNIKKGIFGTIAYMWIDGNWAIETRMFENIRICNKTLDNIDMLTDATESQKNDLIAQSYFFRAYSHFELFRLWGPMPYITQAIGPEDQWDIARLTKHMTCIKIAQDLDTAYTYFEKAVKIRRDPGPGVSGHLADPEQYKPSGVAAKALKSRALLYAASPLNTEGDPSDWVNAAASAWDALQIALQKEYALLPGAQRSNNYYGSIYTNEHLWASYLGSINWNFAGYTRSKFNGVFMNEKSLHVAVCPTQNFVDKYETSWGESLETQADRDAAATAGHYKEQNMYINRDPRLDMDIIYNQSPAQGWQLGKAQIWIQKVGANTVYSELLNQAFQGITSTGYYLRKLWPNNSAKNQTPAHWCEPFIRLAELYLNYAEASNEAYGPTTIGVTGATLSALDAINIIRARVGQVNVLAQYTADKDIFRDRVKNERCIELSFEGANYYFDTRRWMDAPRLMTTPMMGVTIEKVTTTPAYPTGYMYTRTALPDVRQPSWKDAMYYFPMRAEDAYKMKKFVVNEPW